jgi:ATP-dependent DNA ligase
MRPPVMPPVKPMLAKSVPDVPVGEFLYEPKWDGFRRNWLYVGQAAPA